ncbi:MAG: hypothetical protein AB7V45_01390 [Candidatus Krumholzibacteriia bacterium]
MSILKFFYQNGLWLSWPVFALGIFVLWTCITAATKLGERNRIAALPLVAEQEVTFPEAGKAVLWLESPQLSRRFSGLGFELRGSDGSVNKGSRVLMRNRSSGFALVRISDRTFDIPHGGSYTLVTTGLDDPRPDDVNHHLIFMRPHQIQTIKTVLGIVLGAILTIGAIVNFFLRLSMGVKP